MRTRSLRALTWGLKQLASAGWWELLTLVLLTATLGAIPLVSLVALQQTVNWVISPTTAWPITLLILWGTVFLSEKASYPLLSILRIRLNEKALAHFNTKLMEKSNSIDGLSPFESKDLRSELDFLEVESSRRPMNVVYVLTDLLQGAISIGCITFLLSTFSWSLGLVVLIASLPHSLAIMWFEKLRWNQSLFSGKEAQRLRWLSSLCVKTPSVTEMRIFGFGPFLVQQYKQTVSQFLQAFSARCWREILPAMSASLLTVCGYIGVLLWLILRARTNALPPAALIVALQGFTLLQAQLAGLLQDLAMLNPALDYFVRFRAFLTRRDLQLPRSPTPHPFTRIAKGIRFESVSFAYPDGRLALQNISFSIAPGEKVALVGENGAGKTTLVKLLLRFYDPTGGRITIDGVDLKDLDLEQWRKHCSALFQDYGRYHFTLRENIELGDAGNRATLNELRQALENSSALSLADERLDSPLGPQFGGTDLSGGQWQKLAMARAFLRKQPQLLVLDEPSASLDPRSEHEVFESFTRVSTYITTLFVTHRLGAVGMADKIILLKEGHILEQGPHRTLLTNQGPYATLFNLQASRYTPHVS